MQTFYSKIHLCSLPFSKPCGRASGPRISLFSAALVFDKQLLHLDPFLRTIAGFVLFCLISSSVYIFNDLADIEADRQHPEKKKRPILQANCP